MPQLVVPSIEYKNSFIEALAEYQAEGREDYVQLDAAELAQNFQHYIQKIIEQAEGKNLPQGYVPHSVYWLVEGKEYLGQLDVRHQLNSHLETIGGHIGYNIRPSQRRKGYGKQILQLGLNKAKSLGIENVLITCDVDNIASNKIIKDNGGRLENTYPVGSGLPDKNRYWIAIQ